MPRRLLVTVASKTGSLPPREGSVVVIIPLHDDTKAGDQKEKFESKLARLRQRRAPV